MLRIGTVVLGVDDVTRAARFWMDALDYVPRDGAVNDDFVVLVPRHGSGAHLALDRSETPVQEHPRVHLDLYAADAADQAAEVDRLGARRDAGRLGPLPRRPRLRRRRRSRRQPLLRHRHQPRLGRLSSCAGPGPTGASASPHGTPRPPIRCSRPA